MGEGGEIISSKGRGEEMKHDNGAQRLAEMKKAATSTSEAGAFLAEIFAPFDFNGIEVAMPTLTFEHELRRKVGNKTVHLIEVGPAHTRGDVLAYVPEDHVIFTADMLFFNVHPIFLECLLSNLFQPLL